MNPLIQQLIESRKPFPLKSLLILYIRSNKRDTYCNYFEGFKLLKEWLSPIDLGDTTPSFMPPLVGNYEIQELATILGVHQSVIYRNIMEIYSHAK